MMFKKYLSSCRASRSLLVKCRTCSTGKEARKYHLVGQPDPKSNMVPMKHREPTSEDEKILFHFQHRVWDFNHNFWRKHNEDFQTQKGRYISQELAKKASKDTKLTAEELSEFYKAFLDNEYSKHMAYLCQWMKLNVQLTGLMLLVRVKSLLGLQKKLSKEVK